VRKSVVVVDTHSRVWSHCTKKVWKWSNDVSLLGVVEIRTEAVMQALALNKKQSMIPMPSKRTPAVVASQHRPVTAEHGGSGETWLQTQFVAGSAVS